MNLSESKPLVCFYLALKLARLHRDRYVIHEPDPGNLLQLLALERLRSTRFFHLGPSIDP